MIKEYRHCSAGFPYQVISRKWLLLERLMAIIHSPISMEQEEHRLNSLYEFQQSPPLLICYQESLNPTLKGCIIKEYSYDKLLEDK